MSEQIDANEMFDNFIKIRMDELQNDAILYYNLEHSAELVNSGILRSYCGYVSLFSLMEIIEYDINRGVDLYYRKYSPYYSSCNTYDALIKDLTSGKIELVHYGVLDAAGLKCDLTYKTSPHLTIE